MEDGDLSLGEAHKLMKYVRHGLRDKSNIDIGLELSGRDIEEKLENLKVALGRYAYRISKDESIAIIIDEKLKKAYRSLDEDPKLDNYVAGNTFLALGLA